MRRPSRRLRKNLSSRVKSGLCYSYPATNMLMLLRSWTIFWCIWGSRRDTWSEMILKPVQHSLLSRCFLLHRKVLSKTGFSLSLRAETLSNWWILPNVLISCALCCQCFRLILRKLWRILITPGVHLTKVDIRLSIFWGVWVCLGWWVWFSICRKYSLNIRRK